MQLRSGTRLGPYEITALIGAGGMGEVYRAIDTRLSRTVAIKVLPSHLAADPERRQRLEREARIVSSLEHANICGLYDVGHENGRDFLVMQYLQGETLADRLRQGQLPVDRAISVATDIVRALDAAHRRGIVHRDLKPANVMLTKSGVKVLDFGLARLAPTELAARLTDAPVVDSHSVPTQTDSHAVTEQGVMLGTLPYMAPEQIEGRPADARTDIFAFGAVIFEMLTGKRAFEAASAARTMTAILDVALPPPSTLRPEIPPALDRVVRKCLAKDPDDRWQTARDLGDELQWIDESGIGANAPGVPPGRSRLTMAVIAALVALALAAVVFAASRLRTRESAPPAFTRLTFQRGTISSARFSPDGRTVVYAASWEGKPSEIFLTSAGSPEARALGLRDVDLLDVSKTGELAMLRPNGVLAVAPLTGARAPRDISDRVAAAEWGPDGAALAAIRAWDPARSFTPIEFPLGRAIAESSWKGSATQIRVAPDGKSIAITQTPLVAQATRLSIVSLAGELRDLGTWSSITGFGFGPDGSEIWLSGERDGSGPVLWAVTLTGNARVLARYPGEPVLLDVAAGGRVLMATVERRLHMTAVVDGRERDLSWLSDSGVRGITNDGRTVVFEDVSDAPGSARSVWVRTVDGAPAMRLGEGRPLDIAPEGQWVAATITGPPARLVLYPTGPGSPKVLLEGAEDYPSASFLPDGKRLLVVETPMTGRSRAPFHYKLADLATGAVTAIGPETGAVHIRHAVSPDGRSLLVKRQGDGFFVVPLESTVWKWESVRQVPGLEETDFQREWTTEGVYFTRLEPRALRIDRVQVPSGARTFWKRIGPSDLAGVNSPGAGGFFALTPDGRTYAYSYARTLSTLYMVEGLR